jgi:hypothetical protein
MLTAMPFGTKGVSIAVLTAAVLTTAACGGSGKSAATASSTASTPAAATSAASTPAPSTPTAPAGGAPGATLGSARISTLLLTGKDDPGYSFDATKDSTSTTDKQDAVTTGGPACQSFVDAQEALSTKYGTTAEVDRQLVDATGGHAVEDSVMVFPTAAKAASMITDLTTGLQGCKNLSVAQSGGGGITMQPSAIPELTKDGQAGYINYLTAGGKSELMAAELVHTGTAVSVVAFVGPVTNDPNALKQMSATLLAHLSDLQVGRLKAAQGLS